MVLCEHARLPQVPSAQLQQRRPGVGQGGGQGVLLPPESPGAAGGAHQVGQGQVQVQVLT